MEAGSELGLDIHVLTRNNSYLRVIKDLLGLSLPNAQITHAQCFILSLKNVLYILFVSWLLNFVIAKHFGYSCQEKWSGGCSLCC